MGNCLPFLMHFLQQQQQQQAAPSNAANVSINCACFHSNIGDDDDDDNEEAEPTEEQYHSTAS